MTSENATSGPGDDRMWTAQVRTRVAQALPADQLLPDRPELRPDQDPRPLLGATLAFEIATLGAD